MVTFYDVNSPYLFEVNNAGALTMWLQILARPGVYARMKRKPSSEHMVLVIDYYLPFVRTRREDRATKGYLPSVDDRELHERLTYQLRALFESWVGPELSPEITETARALHIAEGFAAPHWTFDEATDDSTVRELEDGLLWPEHVAERLKGERPSP